MPIDLLVLHSGAAAQAPTGGPLAVPTTVQFEPFLALLSLQASAVVLAQPLALALGALSLLLLGYIIFQHIGSRKQHDLFRIVSENAADMIALVDVTGKRLYNSPAYQTVLGYSSEELAATSSLEQVHPQDREKVIEAGKQARTTGVGKRLEYRMRRKDGSWCVLESTASPIKNRSGEVTQMVIINRDITERKRMEEQLEHNAFHDGLTDLPNRTLFLDRLQRAMDHARRKPEFRFAVLFVNVDGLQIFNETMGHSVLDQLIIDVSHRLTAHLRSDDTVSRAQQNAPFESGNDAGILARMDGHEFTILLEGVHDASDPMRVALRVQESINSPFLANGIEVFTCASIGIALNSASYQKAGDILRDAGVAMCRAKAEGKSRCEVFDTEMHAAVVSRLRLETELRKSIEREELCIHYQPIVRLSTRQIVGFESLVRWRRPESSLQTPVNFIDVAEETGLIVPIGRWVLREACRQAQVWQKLYPCDPPLTATVNVSPRQFAHTNLISEVYSAVHESGIDPKTLQLEITETTALNDTKTTSQVLAQLQDKGISASIDDFGTGYSSLSRLRRFPVDVLKIDRSFVGGMENDPESREIVRLIVMLGRHLHLKIIAEGVETKEQQDYLREFQCDYGQGYLYSPPVSAEEFEKLLIANRFAGMPELADTL